jgi:NADPH-dependent curcumin reductase CurA
MPLPTTYRKLVARKLSRNFRDATEIVEVPLPTPAPHEILVKNLFAGVNASDVNISAGVYFTNPTLPFDLGVEAAGEVVAVGTEVASLKVGDHVLTTGLGGGYREYQTAPASLVIPVPQASAELLAVSVSGLTASMTLEIAGEMKSGETVLITGAAGGAGQFAVQLAKQAGNHVIGVTSTDAKAEQLKALGCDRAINYKREDLNAVLQAEYPNGIDLIYENIGGEVFDVCIANIAKRGRCVVSGFISEYLTGPISVTAPRIYHTLLWKSATLRGFLFSDYVPQIPEHMGKMLTAFGTGKIQAVVDPTEFRGVESIVSAVEYMHAGKNSGKVVIRF